MRCLADTKDDELGRVYERDRCDRRQTRSGTRIGDLRDATACLSRARRVTCAPCRGPGEAGLRHGVDASDVQRDER